MTRALGLLGAIAASLAAWTLIWLAFDDVRNNAFPKQQDSSVAITTDDSPVAVPMVVPPTHTSSAATGDQVSSGFEKST